MPASQKKEHHVSKSEHPVSLEVVHEKHSSTIFDPVLIENGALLETRQSLKVETRQSLKVDCVACLGFRFSGSAFRGCSFSEHVA